jgi:hypothetical protein
VITSNDPLLAALADARQRKQRADHDIRLLLAYARCLTQPRPYRLTDLASAAGMSISGVRTAYTDDDVTQARELLGHRDGVNRLHSQAIAALLSTDSQQGIRAAIT